MQKEEIRNEEFFRSISERVNMLLAMEDRKDAEFRFGILVTEIGDIGKYMTHDKILNPNARPHGTKEDEKLAFGQVAIQLMAFANLRGINYFDALSLGLKNWEEADWRKKESKILQNEDTSGEIRGLVGCQGYAMAPAFKISSRSDSLKFLEAKIPSIIVSIYAKPDLIQARDYIRGIVSDNGGMTCHAAVISRELGIPCIVGARDAFSRIAHGDMLELNAEPSGKNYVRILKGYLRE